MKSTIGVLPTGIDCGARLFEINSAYGAACAMDTSAGAWDVDP
jgi:hypothetical protein